MSLHKRKGQNLKMASLTAFLRANLFQELPKLGIPKEVRADHKQSPEDCSLLPQRTVYVFSAITYRFLHGVTQRFVESCHTAGHVWGM